MPVPSLEILDTANYLDTDLVKLEIKKIKIYPKLINIYNLKSFKAKKIVLDRINTSLKTNELQILNRLIYQIKNKIKLNNLELKIFYEEEFLIDLKGIKFSNYGYGKDLISGKIFNKKFKITLDDNFNKINLKLLNTGIIIDFNFNEIKKNSAKGTIKARVLNSNLKFKFEYNNENFKIYDSYYRSKDLSFSNKSIITYKPFFNINSNYDIEDINLKLIKNLNLNKILESKILIKKFNSKNVINYKSKIFSRNIIDNSNLKIDLAYGRLFYSTIFLISENSFNCEGQSNLIEEYPVLYFNCLIISKDKKDLLNEFLINYKNKNELLNLNVQGSLNLLKNRINFTNIQMNKNYKATEEDLNYFKAIFERIFLNKDLFGNFNLKKIKEFILEVS